MVVSKRADEGLDSVRIAHLAESNGSVPTHTPKVLILQGIDQPQEVSLGH
jgi:hypothetical protein